MGKGSIIYEVIQKLESLKDAGLGVSKREMRLQICKETGCSWRDAVSPYIHSISTFESYKRWALECVTWLRQERGIKHLRDLKPELVGDWLKMRMDKGDSASTVKLQAAAMAKLLGVRNSDFGVAMPTRHIADFKRSRQKAKMDEEFSREKNKLLVDFAMATGLRKEEASRIEVRDIRVERDGRVWIDIRPGVAKGGLPRTVHPVASMKDAVLAVYRAQAGKAPTDKVFGHISKKYDEHADRAVYAWRKYNELANVKARDRSDLLVRRNGEVLDKVALRLVSINMGHSRIDVILKNYWYNHI